MSLRTLKLLANMARRIFSRSASSTRSKRRSVHLSLELLENRVMPATISWIASGIGSWNNAANWSTGTVPGAGDDVVINGSPGAFTVTVSGGSDSVHSVTSSEAISISSGTLSIASSSQIASLMISSGGVLAGAGNVTVNSNLTWTGGTDEATGTLTVVSGASAMLSGTVTLANGTLSNAGTMTLASGLTLDESYAALFDNTLGGSLTLQGSATVADTTAYIGVTGYGYSGPVYGRVYSGAAPTFSNEGSVIQSAAGNLNFGVSFRNAGMFSNADGTITLSASNGTVTNTGTIEARGVNPDDSGGTVNVTAQTVQQNGLINVNGQASGGSVEIAFSGSYTDSPSSTITANGTTGPGGQINIQDSSATATLDTSGTYTAVSTVGSGGQISMLAGGYVALHGAQLDTSGVTGGGIISIGYDSTGARSTQEVAIDAKSILRADATNNGNGGSINVGANDRVIVSGSLSAQGSPNGGTGGNINISFGNTYTDIASTLLTVASPTGQGGTIVVEGDENANLTASGTYISDGQTTGGEINMLAGNDVILLGALLRSTGPLGGGTILVGGDFHGAGTIRRAQRTYVDSNTLIDADATENGDGGNVAVWSDQHTDFFGTILARGGSQSGNGGYVETYLVTAHFENLPGLDRYW